MPLVHLHTFYILLFLVLDSISLFSKLATFYEESFQSVPPGISDPDLDLTPLSPLSTTTRSSQVLEFLHTPQVLSRMAAKVPSFAFCGRYTGKDMSASRWIKSFKYEMSEFRGEDGRIPPTKYLHYLDLLLLGEAAEWVKSNPEAVRLMTTPDPTDSTVSQFVSLLQERFPSKAVESAPVSFDLEVSELEKQTVQLEKLRKDSQSRIRDYYCGLRLRKESAS